MVGCWYDGGLWCRWLVPLAWIFGALAGARRGLYRLGWRQVTRLPVPVVVVGNITAGGTGKTPLVLWLVGRLRAAGYRPGIISRGHAGSAAGATRVSEHSDPLVVGDEPSLLARRCGCPVWIGSRRAEAGRGLLTAHPEVDLLVCDDGLQHYALARDFEIAVIDGERGLGNGLLLPAGPLREGPQRLREVDAVVVNGGAGDFLPPPGAVAMRLVGRRLRNLLDPRREAEATQFAGRTVSALAGIGHPQRFFRHLQNLGLEIRPQAFPDHHPFSAADLPAGTVIMTEKDAVKCAAFAHSDTWVLAVDAEVDPGLEQLLLTRLESRRGQQTA